MRAVSWLRYRRSSPSSSTVTIRVPAATTRPDRGLRGSLALWIAWMKCTVCPGTYRVQRLVALTGDMAVPPLRASANAGAPHLPAAGRGRAGSSPGGHLARGEVAGTACREA